MDLIPPETDTLTVTQIFNIQFALKTIHHPKITNVFHYILKCITTVTSSFSQLQLLNSTPWYHFNVLIH